MILHSVSSTNEMCWHVMNCKHRLCRVHLEDFLCMCLNFFSFFSFGSSDLWQGLVAIESQNLDLAISTTVLLLHLFASGCYVWAIGSWEPQNLAGLWHSVAIHFLGDTHTLSVPQMCLDHMHPSEASDQPLQHSQGQRRHLSLAVHSKKTAKLNRQPVSLAASTGLETWSC